MAPTLAAAAVVGRIQIAGIGIEKVGRDARVRVRAQLTTTHAHRSPPAKPRPCWPERLSETTLMVFGAPTENQATKPIEPRRVSGCGLAANQPKPRTPRYRCVWAAPEVNRVNRLVSPLTSPEPMGIRRHTHV